MALFVEKPFADSRRPGIRPEFPSQNRRQVTEGKPVSRTAALKILTRSFF